MGQGVQGPVLLDVSEFPHKNRQSHCSIQFISTIPLPRGKATRFMIGADLVVNHQATTM